MDSWFMLSDNNSITDVPSETKKVKKNQYKTNCYNITIYKKVAQRAETSPCGILGASVDELQPAVFAGRRPLMISKKFCKN
jgi:hypothetical protein